MAISAVPTGPAGGPVPQIVPERPAGGPVPQIVPERPAPTPPMAPPDLVGATLPLIQFDGPETGDLEMFPAQFDSDAIDNNFWWLFERRTWEHQFTLAGQMSEALYGDPKAWKQFAPPVPATMIDPSAYLRGAKPAPNDGPALDRLFADMARMKRDDPGRFANFPASRTEMENLAKNTANSELQTENADAKARLANRTNPNLLGGIAAFGGGMAAAVTDAEGVALLPFGMGSGTLARTLLVESFLGAAGAGLQVPGQQRQAARLGTEAPDPVEQIIMGAAFGAALPLAGRGLRLGVNSFTKAGRISNRELLGLAAKEPDLPPAQRGAVAALAREQATLDSAPEGIDPGAHAAAMDAAGEVLADDAPQIVRGSDVVPPQPQTGPVSFAYEAGGNADPAENLVGYVTGRLIDKGMDPHVAMGFVGNFMAESGRGLNTGAIGDGGNAIGIAQWNGPRKRALQGFAEARGTDWRDIDTQIDYLWSELNGPEYAAWARIQDAPDAATAAKLVSNLFERPGVPHLSSRLAYARMLADQYARGEVPKGGAPGRWRDPGDDAAAAGALSFDPADLQVDANAYQFKSGGDQFGVTDRLQGERVWDPNAAIGVMVHERLDGGKFIVDGHQRHGLASRMMAAGQEGIRLVGTLYREADGYSVEDVRAMAAIKNIRQESGTPIDAAKILRDRPDLLAQVNGSRTFMLQARGLADLMPAPFQAVINGVIPQHFGALVGRLIPDDAEMQAVAIATLKKVDPSNEVQAESVVRDIRRLGLEAEVEGSQMNLFGDGFDLRSTVINERAKIIDAIQKNARSDRRLFGKLEQQAATIQEAGNVLNRSENLTRADIAQRVLDRFLIAAEQPGPIRDAVDAAAKRLRDGGSLDAAVRDVSLAIARTDGAPAGRGAADGVDGGGAEGARLTPPNLADLPAVGDARIAPGLFDDPIDNAAEITRLTALERDMARRLQAEPGFDMALPIGTPDAQGRTPTISLRDELADQARETEFVEQLEFLCPLKGP